MKLILSLALLIGIAIGNPLPAFAYDLTVDCDDIHCALSSHDPLFSGSEQWSPEKSVEKSILIKNTGTEAREVFLKTIPDDTDGTLDPYMAIMLTSNGNTIWEGTLEDLLLQEIIVIAIIPTGTEYEISFFAAMDTATPNTMQGQSSAFDFGFGYEDSSGNQQNNSDTAQNNAGNASSDNASSPPQTSLQTASSVLETAIAGGIFSDNSANGASGVSTVLAGATKNAKNWREGLTFDTGTACSTHPFWPLALIVETIVIFIIRKSTRGKKKLMLTAATVLISGALLYLLV